MYVLLDAPNTGARQPRLPRVATVSIVFAAAITTALSCAATTLSALRLYAGESIVENTNDGIGQMGQDAGSNRGSLTGTESTPGEGATFTFSRGTS